MSLILQAIALLSALAGSPSAANAQVSGYLFRGSGPPVNSTSLEPPAGYPFPGGAPRQAPSPTSVGLPISPSQGTYTKDGFAALGACYCAPVSSRLSHCQVHLPGSTLVEVSWQRRSIGGVGTCLHPIVVITVCVMLLHTCQLSTVPQGPMIWVPDCIAGFLQANETLGESWCFRVVTTMGNMQTTSGDCDPPLDFECQLVPDSPAVYSQISGEK